MQNWLSLYTGVSPSYNYSGDVARLHGEVTNCERCDFLYSYSCLGTPLCSDIVSPKLCPGKVNITRIGARL